MAVKISPEQIERLYRFTREHFVYHYDIQTELVDHLCNDIEAQWEQHPKLPFEEALQIAFKKFGVFGFQDVVEAKSKALEKRYFKIIYTEFKNTILSNKGWMFLSIFFTLLLTLQMIQHNIWVMLGIAALLVLYTFYEIFSLRRNRKKQEENSGKKYLFDEMLSQVGNGSFGLHFPLQMFVQFSLKSDHFTFNWWGLALWSLVITIFIAYNYIAFYVVAANKEKYLKEVYPERFIHA